VLCLLAWGYTNKEAAGKLGLSVKTVDTYRARLTHKLGFTDRVQMVAYALQQGWLEA
jgi:DNA-binding NarL/FixJ family response regulator